MFGYVELNHTVPDFSRFTPDMGISVESWKGNEKKAYINDGYFIPIKCLERDSFNFIEYVFVSCLHSSVRSQSIKVLNQPADTKARRRSARTRFKNFYDTLYDLRKEFIFVFLNHLADSIDESIQKSIDSDGCIAQSDSCFIEWFGSVRTVAELIADGYISSDLDTKNSETVDCKEPLIHSKNLPKLYRHHLTYNKSFLSHIPVSIYRDACWVAYFTNDVVQLVTESVPELFRAFQESSIIPGGKRVIDYMKELI